MIISASRRTDIPAFFSKWFINSIRAGFCEVSNPYNPRQVSRISLLLEDVDVIVFWTRYARALFSYLDELDDRGYRYYFQYTLVDYPEFLEPRAIPVSRAIDVFVQLSEKIGPHRVVWRYDPIVFGSGLDPDYHRERFATISEELDGHTNRVMVSLVDMYRKLQRRLKELRNKGLEVTDATALSQESFGDLMGWFAKKAQSHGMEIFSCAEQLQLEQFGIKPGKCIDDSLIRKVFDLDVNPKKDPSQRNSCGCVISRDIGMYDTCDFGCRYCYASTSSARIKRNLRSHDPFSSALVDTKYSLK